MITRTVKTAFGEISLPETKRAIRDNLRITWHWSGTPYKAIDPCKAVYHFLVDKNGGVHQGVRVGKNLTARTGKLPSGYARHVRRGNSNNIGISAISMGGASEKQAAKGNYGRFPITSQQVAAMVEVTAQICLFYSIPVVPQRVLVHCEWSSVRRVRQSGKWDINCIPHLDLRPKQNPDGTFDSANHLRRLTAYRVAELTRTHQPELFDQYKGIAVHYNAFLSSAKEANLPQSAINEIERLSRLDPFYLIAATDVSRRHGAN